MHAVANRHRRHLEFSVGDRVLLKLQQYRQHSVARPISAKLSRRFYDPFEVLERIGEVAYRLKLPEGSRIHNVFHVSLLRPFVEINRVDWPDFPVVFAQGLPIARPTKLLARRTVLSDNVPQEEGQLAWSDDGGTAPTWEPISVIKRHFPNLLEGKELLNEGGVDTGTTTSPIIESSAEEPEPQETETVAEFETAGEETLPSETPNASNRPRRQPKPIDRYGDFVSR